MRIRLNSVREDGLPLKSPSKEVSLLISQIYQDLDLEWDLILTTITDETYSIYGSISLKKPDLCSRCGDDFKFKGYVSVSEVLIPLDKTKSDEDNSTEWTYKDETFDFGQFLVELVGLNLPIAPSPEVDQNGKCSQCHLNKELFSYDEHPDLVVHPMAVLKNLRPN
jgi:uncharacterized protein